MEKDNYHRLNNDPDVIDGFSRTLPEIEWLTLVLILFYLTVGDVEETVKPLLILASCLFAIVIIVFQYINFFNESKEWKISVQTWLMILYISYVLWYSGKLDSPLFNLYLLPIIASAITLDKLATFLKTGLIGLTMLYFQSSEANEGILPSLTESGELLLLFFPIVLVTYITTMLSADIQRGFNRLKIISETDELTKLFNRRSLNRLALKMFGMATRHNRSVSALMVDVDNLKPVNDKFGHDAGNLLLINIAQCLSSVLREEDIAARYGGDEFIVMLSDCSITQAQQVAKRIIHEFNQKRLSYKGSTIELSASIGIASFPEHGQTVEEVVQNADIAMYSSKEQGNNLVSVYGQK